MTGFPKGFRVCTTTKHYAVPGRLLEQQFQKDGNDQMPQLETYMVWHHHRCLAWKEESGLAPSSQAEAGTSSYDDPRVVEVF